MKFKNVKTNKINVNGKTIQPDEIFVENECDEIRVLLYHKYIEEVK